MASYSADSDVDYLGSRHRVREAFAEIELTGRTRISLPPAMSQRLGTMSISRLLGAQLNIYMEALLCQAPR
jgi:hypothetical protein